MSKKQKNELVDDIDAGESTNLLLPPSQHESQLEMDKGDDAPVNFKDVIAHNFNIQNESKDEQSSFSFESRQSNQQRETKKPPVAADLNFETIGQVQNRNAWDTILNHYPVIRNILQLFTKDLIGVNTGGITHRQRRFYTCEGLCPLYFILLIILLDIDLQIMQPAMDGKIAKLEVEQKPVVGFLNPTLSDFHNNTNFTVTLAIDDFESITCADMVASFNDPTSGQTMHMKCEDRATMNLLSFTFPNKSGNHLLNQTQQNLLSQHISFDCRREDKCIDFLSQYTLQISYNRIMASSANKNGTTFTHNQVEDVYSKTEMFQTYIYLTDYVIQEAGAPDDDKLIFKEGDDDDDDSQVVDTLSIDTVPTLSSLMYWQTQHSGLYSPHLGDIYFYERDSETVITIYRESYIKYMAIVAGYNIFILGIFNWILRYCVRWSFKNSLRQEIRGRSHQSSGGGIVMDLKKVVTPMTEDDRITDEEINKHLSLENLYQMSKVVRLQHDKIFEQQDKIDRLQWHTKDKLAS